MRSFSENNTYTYIKQKAALKAAFLLFILQLFQLFHFL